MPRDPITGVFTRVANSFSDPVFGTDINPSDAISLFNDYDAGLTNSVQKEPVIVSGATAIITAGTSAVAVERTSPATTGLTLPSVVGQDGTPIHIVDWSTSVTDHVITITPNGAETIMRAASWQLASTAAQLSSLTLYPSTTLNGWYL